MKATISANELIKKLPPFGVISSSTFPIASKLKLDFNPPFVNIQATDYSVFFSVDVGIFDADGTEAIFMPILVDTKKFIAFVRKMGKDKNIKLSFGKRLTMSSGNARIQLAYSSGEDFPVIKYDAEEAVELQIDSKDLMVAIGDVSFATAAKDMDLQPISYIALDFVGGKIIATDAIIIASSQLPKLTTGYIDNVLIGAKNLELIRKSIQTLNVETLTIHISKGVVKFVGEDGWVSVLIHNKQFPTALTELTDRTPSDFPLRLKLSKQELTGLLSMGLFYGNRLNVITLSVDEYGHCTGTIKDEQDEVIYEFSDIPIDEECVKSIVLSFDSVRMSRLVEHIKTDEIEFFITTEDEPIYIIFGNQVYLQSPIRI